MKPGFYPSLDEPRGSGHSPCHDDSNRLSRGRLDDLDIDTHKGDVDRSKMLGFFELKPEAPMSTGSQLPEKKDDPLPYRVRTAGARLVAEAALERLAELGRHERCAALRPDLFFPMRNWGALLGSELI
jgi:hypothetical protein